MRAKGYACVELRYSWVGLCVWLQELVFMHVFLCSIFARSEFDLVLSIMSVSFKVLLFSRLLIITFNWLSLGWIQDKGTAFFIGVFDTFDIILNVLL